ncbi:MAG: hypothetical protein LBG23_05430, partial [Endomicrobium sp.]|nr:hypothetical protein [Endomicrobium sp.]
YVAWSLNFIVLTAALSVYNSCLYSNSRMLYALALQKNAPYLFSKTNKNKIPVNAILVSGMLTFLVVPLNYFMSNWFDAFKIVMSFIVTYILVNWAIITLSHIKFKQINKQTLFPSPFYPYSNYLTLTFVFFILGAMSLPQIGMSKQVVAIPFWILFVYNCYKITKNKKTLY